jgi:hypothetical protein
MRLNRCISVFLLLVLLVACKEKKKQLSDTEPVVYADFIDFFPVIKLPFEFADTSLLTKTPDSRRIGNKFFKQFVPDSVAQSLFGKGSKPQFFPIGKIEVKDGETYVFVKAVQAAKQVVVIAVFDKEKFVTAMPAVVISGNPKPNDRSLVNMDSRYTITTLRQKTATDGQVVYNKKVYVYNNAGVFTMILTESNDRNNAEARIINPIDTLATMHKLTGDYMQDKKNIVSFRDGRKAGFLLFFIHFEKEGGACKGELKGDAKITSPNSARYTESNGTCSIDFSFSGNTVTMKEVEGCGSYRDIKCFFEGNYTRKKRAIQKNQKKKK